MTAEEQQLLDYVYKGFDAEFAQKTKIGAQFLHDHILEITRGDSGSPSVQPCHRWVIHNAVFEETLKLQDGRRHGSASLPALEFHGCEFHAGFLADGAHIDRLVFENCSFTSDRPSENFISLRNAHVNTEIRLKGLRPFDKPGEESPIPRFLWVDGFAVTVGTNFVINDTMLRAPEEQSSAVLPEPRYALDLSTASIHCDVQLQPNVRLEGGLKMRDAHVGGTIWAQGLYTTDGETRESRSRIAARREETRSAFRLEGSHIEGRVALGVLTRRSDDSTNKPKATRFSCEGRLDLNWVRIDGSLELSGAFVGTAPDAALSLYSARLGELIGNPVITPHNQINWKWVLEVTTSIDLRACRISGKCDIELTFVKREQLSLFAEGLSVSGNLTLKGAIDHLEAAGLEVSGDTVLVLQDLKKCNLGGAALKGKLDLSDVLFDRPPEQALRSFEQSAPGQTAAADGIALSLRDADIGHMLVVSPLFLPESAKQWSLRCYPGFALYEVVLRAERSDDSRARTASFLSNGKQSHLLSGESAVFREINREGRLEVFDPAAAAEYLRLFASYTWGDNGAFALIESASGLPQASRGKLEVHPVTMNAEKSDLSKRRYVFDAFVRYGFYLYKAQFEVGGDGKVEMKSDQGVVRDENNEVVAYQPELTEYRKPFRLLTGTASSDFSPDAAAEIDRSTFELRVPDWNECLMAIHLGGVRGHVGEVRGYSSKLHVDLRDASCATLNDNAGLIWGIAKSVELEEFTYNSLFLPPGVEIRDEVEARLRWLSGGVDEQMLRARMRRVLRVFGIGRREQRRFRAQPYSQLAKAFRQRGDDEAAREVEKEKIRLAAYDRASSPLSLAMLSSLRGCLAMLNSLRGRLAMAWWWFYGLGFRFGLSPLRAFFTVVVLWFVGFVGIQFLDQNDLLKANISTFAAAAIVRPKGDVIPFLQPAPNGPPPKLPCGDSINPGLYAAELLIPILNLHQANRCEIREEQAQDAARTTLKFAGRDLPVPHFLVLPVTWEYVRAIYLILGSIVTSIALLTFSGIARRWER